MSPLKRILFFFVLPIIAVLSYKPTSLMNGLQVIAVAVIGWALLGILLWRGSSRALTFAIWLQGMNVIIRLMMLFPNSNPTGNAMDYIYIIFNLIGLCLSMYLLLRLDKDDIRVMLVN